MDGEVELTVPVPGRDPLRLRREVHLGPGAEQTVSMRLALPGARKWEPWRFGGQPMFLRGAGYAPAYRLDELTEETLAADIALAKAANVDALRVIANVLPKDFYRLADEAGMLIVDR